MSALQDFRKTPAPGNYANAAGMIFVMRCVPDIFTSERLNIGVCAISNTGERKAKVVTEAGRLQCLYGEGASNVLLLAQAALEAAKNGAPSPSPQVVFDTPMPYYNCTVEEIVESSFADQVTVALPHREVGDKNSWTDDVVQQKIADIVRLQSDFEFADLLATTPQVIVNTERGPRTMMIPLQPPHGVGTIRSAFYSPATLKTHLMDSVLDLECAARYRQKRTQGLFILRPKKPTPKEARAIDSVVDSVGYRTPPGLMLEQADDLDELAGMIKRWALTAA